MDLEGGEEALDCLRQRVWDDERVEWWYAQNLLLFGINPTMAGYEDQQMIHLYSQLQLRFAALPGV